MSALDFEISLLKQRLNTLHRIGTVAEIQGAKARVNFEEHPSAFLPIVAPFAGGDVAWHGLSEGEQVLVIAVGGTPERAVIIGSLYQDSAKAPTTDPKIHTVHYADGTKVTYDQNSTTLSADLAEGGTFQVKAETSVLDSNVKITGELDCDKSIKAAKEIKDKGKSMSEMRSEFDDHTGHSTADGKPTNKMGD